jgi:FkbM family methyltransferase
MKYNLARNLLRPIPKFLTLKLCKRALREPPPSVFDNPDLKALCRYLLWIGYIQKFRRPQFTLDISKSRVRAYNTISIAPIFIRNWYEPIDTTILSILLKPDSVFIDVGANLGIYSLLASEIINHGRIYAIEPSQRDYERLVDHINLNKRDNIIPINKACSDKQRLLCLHIADNSFSGENSVNYLPKVKQPTTEVIHAEPLDMILGNLHVNRVDMIKIDVEGYEYNVLLGAQETLQKYRPALLIERPDTDVLKYLEQQNYSFCQPPGMFNVLCLPN